MRSQFAAHLLCSLLGVAPLALGCAPLWAGSGGTRELATIDDADGNTIYLFGDIDPDTVSDIPMPRKLRPCCAFGSQIGISLGQLPIHGFSLDNIVDLDELGRHKYDNGLLSTGGSGGELVASEKNGLAYTCRGGFIDTAHLRDYADWTAFFTAWIAKRLETGGEVELPSEAGVRRVVLNAVAPEIIREQRVRGLATSLAEYLVYRLSIWHEIATWYGWSAIALFPERASAFSPEDLYSNLLGIKIAQSMVEVGVTGREDQYNENVDRWMVAVFERLAIVDDAKAMEVALALDGYWWDSTRRLPDARLVMRRHMDTDEVVAPWLAGDSGSAEVQALLDEACPDGQHPVRLSSPDSVGAHEMSSLIRLEIEVDPKYAAFPLPRPPSRVVTHDDFDWIIERIRSESLEEFGPGSDTPGAASDAAR